MNESYLIQKGFIRQPDGSWSKPSPAIRSMAPRQPEQIKVRPLDQGVQKRQTRKGSVAIIVTLITCRRRECDDDGNVAALKPLRDAIAEGLGLDDGDKRIRWEYGQIETRGKCGVIVNIQM